MAAKKPFRLVIFISGRGSNMRAIAEACASGALGAEIALVLSDKANAGGLDYARSVGINTAVVTRRAKERSAEEFFEELGKVAAAANPDLIALAGFMRILSDSFINRFPNKIVNIHPSLLPAFRGLHAQQQAFDAGVMISGCTVHYVIPELDAGPIIAQTAVAVLPQDTVETLSARILREEHLLYPAAIELIVAGKVRLNGAGLIERSVETPSHTQALRTIEPLKEKGGIGTWLKQTFCT